MRQKRTNNVLHNIALKMAVSHSRGIESNDLNSLNKASWELAYDRK